MVHRDSISSSFALICDMRDRPLPLSGPTKAFSGLTGCTRVIDCKRAAPLIRITKCTLLLAVGYPALSKSRLSLCSSARSSSCESRHLGLLLDRCSSASYLIRGEALAGWAFLKIEDVQTAERQRSATQRVAPPCNGLNPSKSRAYSSGSALFFSKGYVCVCRYLGKSWFTLNF